MRHYVQSLLSLAPLILVCIRRFYTLNKDIMKSHPKSFKRKSTSFFGVLLAWVFLISSAGYAQPAPPIQNVQTAQNIQTSAPTTSSETQDIAEECVERAKTDNCCPNDQPPPCSGDDNCVDPCVSTGIASAILGGTTGLIDLPRNPGTLNRPTANSGLSPYTTSPPPRN